MGYMHEGTWHVGDAGRREGRFVRTPAGFRDWIGVGGLYEPEPNRYHLYVSKACPWASRTVIVRKLKKLESVVPMTTLHSDVDNGWAFGPSGDPVNGLSYLYELYRAADSGYSGRATIPVLWDTKTSTIVNNESADIIRMLGSAFDQVGAAPGDYYPAASRADIDAINQRVYDTLNNGVYKAGFATTQAAYEAAVVPLFETLDWLEDRLSQSRFLCGEALTEADIRLFTTLVRFDSVYYGHFKCNIRRIADYRNLWAYTRDIYQLPGIAETVDLGHIKRHYYTSHRRINPTGIVPAGPALDFAAPADRDRGVDKLIVF
jgi:glutathionyl-hydroquinone reductase